MQLRHLFALLLGVLLAQAASAVPVRFFGQDAPSPATQTLDPAGAAAAARADFLSYLDPATISTLNFDGLTTQTRPARDPNAPYASLGTVNFFAQDSNERVPAQILATSSAIQNAPYIGTYATSGSGFLYVVGYDQGSGITRGGVRIDYRPDLVTAGTTPKPFSSFGAYITDTEGYSTITLVLTPVGGNPDGSDDVTLDFRGIQNQGQTGLTPGNAQVSFIGFIDSETQYERIDIRFTDSAGIENNEAFGFDDFTVGEVGQFTGTQETVAALDIVDEPGWRLLSAPVEGVSVADLAKLNLVQGVAAGDGVTQQQYPEAGSNFYIAYDGGTRWDYIPVATTGTELVPGRGFWWYWYDRDINPDDAVLGGGTSESVALDGFFLSAIGDAVSGNPSQQFDDNTNCASDQSSCSFPFTTPNGDPTLAGAPEGTVTPADDDFYMIGNPFSFPMDFSAVTASGGTMAAQGFIWNPGNQSGTFPRTGEDIGLDGPGTYEVVFASPPPGEQGAVAVWNGVLVEVTKDLTGATPTTTDDPGNPVTFTFDAAIAATVEDPLFHGKTGDAPAPEAFVQFGLFGETESGAKTRDETAYLRFTPGATLGWDPSDASKPAWPSGAVGLVAVDGERFGKPTAQAIAALPPEAADRRTPLSLKLSEAGTYELVWRSTGLRGHVRDLVTGTKTPLSAGRYLFTSDGTGGEWARRFRVRTFPAASGKRDQAKAGGPLETFVGAPTPNPAIDAFRLDVRLDADATVSVYDALGRRVASREVRASEEGESVQIPTERLAPGAYVIVVEAPGVRETRRVTVVR